MREILFRGKRIDGEWKYGNLIVAGTNKDVCYITEFAEQHYHIQTETIGQYTGLTDKNGKKIFEGDIVKLTDKSFGYKWKAVVEFGNPNGNYTWGWQLKPIGKAKNVNTDILCWVEMEEAGAYCEVIGNRWDNRELLNEN